MKVIGYIDKEDISISKVLVEVSKEELMNIKGKKVYTRNDNEFKIGDIIEVNRLYKEAKEVLNFYRNLQNDIMDIQEKSNFLLNKIKGDK